MSPSMRRDSASDAAMEKPGKRPRMVSRRPGVTNSRGVTACERCRARKTKCDNMRPSCGHCAKIDVECIYADDAIPDPLQELGERVLGAIDDLASVVKRQRQCCPTCATNNHNNILSGDCELADPPSWALASTPPLLHDFSDSAGISRDARTADFDPHGYNRNLSEGRLEPQGPDTILSWSIFDSLHLPTLSFEDTDHAFAFSETMPNLERTQLTHLADRYIHGVHVMNPFLNLNEVQQIIHQIGETGPDWTTKTCLVALIAAIGSINSLCHNDFLVTATPEALRSPPEHEEVAQAGMQYWSLAVKRLALAVGQNDIQAVQCLCLAGIYCMHRLQPQQAWKYFTLAGAAWHVLNRSRTSDHDVFARMDDLQSFTLMQSLYFTIWKSECELLMELDVPGPILDNVNFADAFPLPPALDAESPANEVAEHERVWLYYLAEIAARHHLNRLFKTYRYYAYEGQPSNKIVGKMLAHADMMEAQIQEWHTSLPAIFRFEIPEGFVLPYHSSELTHVLRTRYLGYRELLSRPFLRLCVETAVNFEAETRRRVIELASQNVRFSVLKMSQSVPQRHQGTWLGLRSLASTALILSSVHFARQKLWLPGAQEVTLPDDWRDKLLMTYNLQAVFFNGREGGAQNIRNLLQTLLAV